MKGFMGAVERQFLSTTGTHQSVVLKSAIDKFITDLAGLSEPFVTPKTREEFLKKASGINAYRTKALLPLFDTFFAITINSTNTYGLNKYHFPPCPLIKV